MGKMEAAQSCQHQERHGDQKQTERWGLEGDRPAPTGFRPPWNWVKTRLQSGSHIFPRMSVLGKP